MIQIKEVQITRILNPTSIDLGEYVINPYKGCEFACLYCYVRSNKVVAKESRRWGEYVDIRVNAAELLEKEILKKKPQQVLLGSTTECFQPIEKKYGITRQVLEVLNKHGIFYVILTRSPYIAEYIPLLKQGFCKSIYFTINDIPPDLKNIIEPKSPSYTERWTAINKMLEEGIKVIPYFSPILPWVSDFGDVFSKFSMAQEVEFEGLNFRVGNINEIIAAIVSIHPELKNQYERMSKEKDFYSTVWKKIREDVKEKAQGAKKFFHIHLHNLDSYFNNSYVT